MVSYDVDLVEQYAVKAVSPVTFDVDSGLSCDVDLEQCLKAVSCDVLLTSDSLAYLDQYESICNLVGGASTIPSLKGWAQCLLGVL